MCAKRIEPFEYKNRLEFHEKLVEWIGDVLYDILPEHGYEIRDEQVFTAFQIADAFGKKRVHLAEAGLGTGKTIAYLLSAIPYARMTGKPVAIACATSSLQEQLIQSGGDYHKLSTLLGLEVDARVAKNPRHYICDIKVEEYANIDNAMANDIQLWLNETKFGERTEMPHVPDDIWKKIAWDESMDCDTCFSRGFCKVVKARQHYRAAKDLIIVDHETFFKDLWTRDHLIAEGKLPILPSYSGVVLDEGHKVFLPAIMQAGEQIDRTEMEAIVFALEEIQGARNSLLSATIGMNNTMRQFFNVAKKAIIKAESTERLSLERNENLLNVASNFRKKLDQLLLEMQIEQELYFESIPMHLIQAYEGQIEGAIRGLNRFLNNNENDSIHWLDRRDGSFWIVPRSIRNLFHEKIIKKKLPIVFTSATLSNHGDFDYFIQTIGLQNPSKSTIGSPFDLKKQMKVYFELQESFLEDHREHKIKRLVTLLKENGGRALVLMNTLSQVRKLRKCLEEYQFPFEILWEDQGERGYLIDKFRNMENTVLVGANFWEGIDVPGDALTMLIIWQLPFPVLDPLIEARRKEVRAQGLDSFTEIDQKEMGLKLKQGCGRLIRTKEDKGKIVILDKVFHTSWEDTVRGALPGGVQVIE